MRVEHFPEGVPLTTLAVDFIGVGAINNPEDGDHLAVIVKPLHTDRPIPLSMSFDDARGLREALDAAIKDTEARTTNSN